STNALIYSAEVEGSVIAYRRQTNSSGAQLNVWKPLASDNPRLQNLVGSVGNLFNSSITKTTNGQIVTYTLRAPDGGTRIYTETNFTVGSGSTQILRKRPYLDTWQDSRGNYLKFSYGQNSAYPDWGKLSRIESSSGIFAAFRYDIY